MQPVRMTAWTVVGHYVQLAWDLRARAREAMIGTPVRIEPDGPSGEVVDVRLDDDRGLAFGVSLYEGDRGLGPVAYYGSGEVCWDAATETEVDPDELLEVSLLREVEG